MLVLFSLHMCIHMYTCILALFFPPDPLPLNILTVLFIRALTFSCSCATVKAVFVPGALLLPVFFSVFKNKGRGEGIINSSRPLPKLFTTVHLPEFKCENEGGHAAALAPYKVLESQGPDTLVRPSL